MDIKTKEKFENILDDLTAMVVNNLFDEGEQSVVLDAIDTLHELTITQK